jgi:hypothetical protein
MGQQQGKLAMPKICTYCKKRVDYERDDFTLINRDPGGKDCERSMCRSCFEQVAAG